MTWVRRWLAVFPTALVLVTVWYVASGVAGANWFWYWEPLNLSEAAALRDSGEVARLLDAGTDPNASYEVRAGFLFSTARRMTPLDAARAAHREEIEALLLAGGAH